MSKVRGELEKEVFRWPGVTVREMMGCLCYFRGSKFFAFLVTKGIVITRLSEKSRVALTERMRGKPFMMAGRTAKTWIRVPFKRRQDVRSILPFVKESYTAASSKKKS